MNTVEQFVDRCLKSVDLTSPSAFRIDPNQTLEITGVADGGIADRAGVVRGDRLIAVNGEPATSVGLNTYFEPDRDQVLLVERANGSERLKIRSTGASPGLATQHAAEEHSTSSLAELEECGELDDLWNEGQWKRLQSGCEARLQLNFKTKASLMLSRRPLKSFPVYMLLGAAEYELGDRQGGYRKIHEFRERYEQQWPQHYQAIARFYDAREQIKYKETSKAERRLVEAIELWPCQRIEQCLAELHGRRTGTRIHWEGKPFPIDYNLSSLNEPGQHKLSATLSNLKPTQLLFVALLGGFRSNEKYNRLVRRFIHLAHYFPPFVGGLHAITTTAERTVGVSMPENLKAEDRARFIGLPLNVLLDADKGLTDRIKPSSSPHLIVVDTSTRILHEGTLDDVQWWELLHMHARNLD